MTAFLEVNIIIQDKKSGEAFVLDGILKRIEPNIKIHHTCVVEHLPHGSGTIEVYHEGNKMTFQQVVRATSP